MSGHGVTDRDIVGLVYFARRLREETHGCGEWDELGTTKFVREMKGWNLAVALEQILRHSIDQEARTPKALLRSYRPPAPSEQPKGRPHPPKKGEDCPTHPGQPATNCGGCRADELAAAYDDEPPTPPPAAWSPGDPVAGASACRDALRRQA